MVEVKECIGVGSCSFKGPNHARGDIRAAATLMFLNVLEHKEKHPKANQNALTFYFTTEATFKPVGLLHIFPSPSWETAVFDCWTTSYYSIRAWERMEEIAKSVRLGYYNYNMRVDHIMDVI